MKNELLRLWLASAYFEYGRRNEGVREMGTRGNGDEVTASAVFAVDGFYEFLQDISVLGVLAETHDVDADFLLFELLGQFDEHGLIAFDGRAHKGHNAGLVVFALAMLQRQLQCKLIKA